jgi:hypothetical protein
MRTKVFALGIGTLMLMAGLAACGGGGGSVPGGGPTDVTTFTATAAGTAINLKWSGVADLKNYTLERKTTGGSYAPLASPAANATSYSDSALSASTTYDYRLKTVNTAGSSVGKEASAMTGAVALSKAVLLIDDDASDNNDDPGNAGAKRSAPDTTYQALLSATGVGYDTVVVKTNQDGPTYDQMKGYQTVIWYKGPSTYNPQITTTDLSNIAAYLDDAAHRVILIAVNLFYCADWQAAPTSFQKDVIGASKAGCVQSAENPTLSGVSGAVTAGLSLRTALPNDGYHYLSLLEPAPGTASLLTVMANPDRTSEHPVTIASGHQHVGAAKSSTMIFVGFPLENIVDVGANSKQSLLSTLLAY